MHRAATLALAVAAPAPALLLAAAPSRAHASNLPVRVEITGAVVDADNDFESTSPNTFFGLGSTVTYTVLLDNAGVLPNPASTTRYLESIRSWSVRFGSYEIGGPTGDVFIRQQSPGDQFAIAHNDRRANIPFYGNDRDDADTSDGPIAGVPFTGFDFGTTTPGIGFIQPDSTPLDVFNAIADDPDLLGGSVMRLLFDETLLDNTVEVFGIAQVQSVSAVIVPAPAALATLLPAAGAALPRRRARP